ncbi:AI-2E family transporter [Amycolatopsis acidicola]|uniref:AI-2E family transporter n=2 Tax=Amycolatopsis acidicola TaxID=2596893 RepID=A0A5N0VCR2_9PSEU|nr:AI-2E family transporter [Amycolatopsis acidicola]
MPRALILLIGGASAVILLAGMSIASWLIGPLFLAMVMVIALSPVPRWLRGHGVPSWAATTLLILLVYALVAALVLVLVVSVAQLATVLPTYAARANDLLASVTAFLSRHGIDPARLRPATDQLDFGKLAGYVETLLGAVTSVGTGVLFLLSLLLFVSIEATTARKRQLAIAADRPALSAALSSFVRNTRRYLLMTTLFGFIVAVLDTLGLVILDVPLPVLWGLLSFMTNYIPNIGFILGLVPPALLALLDGGWPRLIAVVVVYCVLNFVVQSVIQPRFVGGAVGLSTIATFVSLVLWGWILGPLGAILAVPLTLLAKALLVDVDPRARWVDALMGSHPPEPGDG